MNTDMTYEASNGEKVAIGCWEDAYIVETDVRDYEWSYDLELLDNPDFFREPQEKKLHIAVMADTEHEGIVLRNRLYKIFESDILARKPGRIHAGAFYLECYIVKSAKGEWDADAATMELELTLLCEYPCWIKESVFEFLPDNDVSKATYLDYPHDYGYDYLPPPPIRTLALNAVTPSSFRMTIYGGNAGVTNPSIYIGNNLYQVDVSIPAGAYLVVDGRERKKAVELVGRDGKVTDVFDYRNKGIPGSGRYVFEKINPGTHNIGIVGLGFTLQTFEERSEPEWT